MAFLHEPPAYVEALGKLYYICAVNFVCMTLPGVVCSFNTFNPSIGMLRSTRVLILAMFVRVRASIRVVNSEVSAQPDYSQAQVNYIGKRAWTARKVT